MNFFYPDGSRAENVSLVLALALLATFFLCLLIDFRANDSFLWLSAKVAVPISGLIAIGAWIVPPIRVPKRSTVKNLFLWLIFLPLLWCAVLVVFLKGVGYLSTVFAGKAGYELAYVAAKSSGAYRRRECDHWVELQVQTTLPDQIKTCISQNLWSNLRVGDPVSLSLRRSSLGYSVRKVSPRDR